MQTWETLAIWVEANLERLQQAWNTQLPTGEDPPSPEIEQSIDKWCEEIVRDPKALIAPPDELKPWLLARLVCAETHCRWYQQRFEVPSIARPREALRRALIDDWHQECRAHWKDLPGSQP